MTDAIEKSVQTAKTNVVKISMLSQCCKKQKKKYKLVKCVQLW